MSKKKFNPADWLSAAPTQPAQTSNSSQPPMFHLSQDDIETIVQRVENACTDIAPNYADWRDLGFALADALGESGRSYYHRLSRFYSGYAENETNKQFDNCLKHNGHGVTLKTFYHLAKSAGVYVSVKKAPSIPLVPKQTKSPISPNPQIEDIEEMGKSPLPTFPDFVYQNLPEFLQSVTAKATSPEDKDLLLLGSLVALSSCLPNIYGIYAERKIFPNLFLFITALASAGKGRLTLCKELIYPIHRELIEQNKAAFEQYQRELNDYTLSNKNDKREMERPKEPPLRMLIIPANNSATGLFQILNDNKGVGLLFETEGDTLAQTFKSEHGNYSDGFRKAFHHEPITYNRRKDREYVELEMPRLSALLSGTPKQVSALIPNAENGLFSRFIFYYMNITPIWKDVFAGDTDATLDDYFRNLGNRFFVFYKSLQYLSEPLRFCLTATQQQQFNAYFAETQNQYLYLCGVDYIATVRRLGLITFRIAMILNTLRLMSHKVPTVPLICNDTDFSTALEIVKILIQHAAKVFSDLPAEQEVSKRENKKQSFLEALPPEFSRQIYVNIAKMLEIPDKTAEKYIAKFKQNGFIDHISHGNYRKR
jgi:hypothetical protein